MRLRQIALVSNDLSKSRSALFSVLGIDEDFQDPAVEEFGLKNSMMVTGDTFLEIVAPQSNDTAAARFLKRNGGDGGYMIIVQTDSLASASAHIEKLGIRKIWELTLPNAGAFHMHPKDTGGGAMLSFDEMTPPESWAWGGQGWNKRSAAHVGNILAVEVNSSNAKQLAERWTEIFNTSVHEVSHDMAANTQVENHYRLSLQQGEIRIFQKSNAATDHISALEYEAVDLSKALEAARKIGLEVDENSIALCGVKLKLVKQA